MSVTNVGVVISLIGAAARDTESCWVQKHQFMYMHAFGLAMGKNMWKLLLYVLHGTNV